MLEFIISNYMIFIIIAVVLLLGLFGYMVDRKKYQEYREEIANNEKALDMLESQPDIQTVATPVLMDATSEVTQTQDPNGSIQN